jgi:Flp pilus assembly protein TadB
MVTWNFDTITAGTLGLMGIAAATAMAGATVDTSKNSTMAAEKAQLQIEAASVPPPSAVRAVQITDSIAELDKQLRTPLHTTWLDDLLSDANGLSFHRFQMFVWTIVLGMIFVISAYTDLLMPDFSATLLGLMGISAGTYVGFKFPEQKN